MLNIHGYQTVPANELVNFFVKHAETPIRSGTSDPVKRATSIVVSSEGSTGLTLLVIMPSVLKIRAYFQDALPSFTPKESELPITFVAKLLRQSAGHNEILLSDLARFLKFKAPQIVKLDPPENHALGTWRNKQVFKRNNAIAFSPELQFVLMKKLTAFNLTSFFDEGHIFQLSIEELDQFFFFIGKLAFFDLLTANDDRLIRLNFSKDPPLDHPSINSGNLMINYDREKKVINKIHLIDNSSLRLFKANSRKAVEDCLDGGFFFEEDKENVGANTPAPPPLEISEPTVSLQAVLKAFHSLRTNPQHLAKHIVRGFKILSRSSSTDGFHSFLDGKGQAALIRGFLEYQAYIIANKSSIKEFLSHHPFSNLECNQTLKSYILGALDEME